jgi:uncharacterized membrane protein
MLDHRRAPEIASHTTKALGAFSLGLGLLELFAPDVLKRSLGLKQPSSAIIRGAYGLRELTAGAALLVDHKSAGWVWARVAGDLLDLATLGPAVADDENPRRNAARAALGAVGLITLVDVLTAAELSQRRRRHLVLPLIGETPIPVDGFEHAGKRISGLVEARRLRELAHALDARKLAEAAGPVAAAALARARATNPRIAIGGGVALLALAAVPLIIVANRRSSAGKGGTTDMPREGVVERAVTVNAPREELYRRWRDFTAAPTWMEIVESVEDLSDDRHRWTVRTPGDKRLSYETVVTEERAGEVLAWESAPGAKIRSTNRLEFRDAPGGRGTEIHAAMTYDPPLGPLGKLAALATQKAPELQVRRDLRRFKQLVEAGEIATTEGPGAAPSSRDMKKGAR